MRFGAVVLAGGTGARLGGADKAALEYDGSTLLERALAALVDADEVVVVGRPVPTARPVTFTLEEPASGGPAAALLAGLEAFGTVPDLLGVVAVDMPWLSRDTFVRLRAAGSTGDGAWLTGAGRRVLAGVVRPEAIAAADPGLEGRHGLPLHRLLAGLQLAAVPAVGPEADDIDTWEDLRALRE